jgi:uncharacterized protein YbjT (DUF2867 family)
MWGAQIRVGDLARGPYAAASTAPFVENDIAAVAAHALLDDDLVGQRIPMTGPELFTNPELVEVIGACSGGRCGKEVPPDVVGQVFIAMGLGAEFADAYIGFLSKTVDMPALVTREVEKILGRPAQPFAEWVAEHQALFTN